MAGYSQLPLIDKLGVKPGTRCIVLRAPAEVTDSMEQIADRATLLSRLTGLFDFIHYYASSTEQLEAVLPNLKRHTKADGGMLWISWAKKNSPKHTGLTEPQVRELALRVGLVDVKVASLTEDWSGLKFVINSAGRSN